jgi:hypothetical protein
MIPATGASVLLEDPTFIEELQQAAISPIHTIEQTDT